MRRSENARNNPLSAPLIVQLSSSDPSEARVPPSIKIPAGQSGLEFDITPFDDLFADGEQSVQIAARADGFVAGTGTVKVSDNEIPTLKLTITPARLRKGGRAGVAVLERNSEVTASTPALRVTLSGTPTGQSTFAGTVLIPAAQSRVSVAITPVDDRAADGPRQVAIVAWATDIAHYIVRVDGQALELESIELTRGALWLGLPKGSLSTGASVEIEWSDLIDGIGKIVAGQTTLLIP